MIVRLFKLKERVNIIKRMIKAFVPLIFTLLFIIPIGCGNGLDGLLDDYYIALNDDKDILVFNFLSSENNILSSDAIGTVSDTSVDITIPYGKDISALIPNIEISGISINPPDGTSQRFDSDEGLTYIVIAENGTTKDYTVTIHVIDWKYPSALSGNISPDGQDGRRPVAAMDASGNTIVVWDQFDGINNQIYMREYRNGSWSPQPALSESISPRGTNCFNPQVAMDDNGNVIIVWMQYVSANQIFKSEYRNGEWTHPSISEGISYYDYSAHNPYVAMDNKGNAIIVWSQYDGSYERIYFREYRSGAWSPEPSLAETISPDVDDSMLPTVAMDNNGNAIISWIQYDVNCRRQVFVSEYRNGEWTHPIDNTDFISPGEKSVIDYNRPGIAMDENNNAIIVWSQYDGCEYQVYKRECRDGDWLAKPLLSESISIDDYDALYPVVGLDNNGNAIIAWSQDNGSNTQIYMREYRDGGWSEKPDLPGYISLADQNAMLPSVAMDNNGNSIVSWIQSDGSNNRMYMREYRNGSWSGVPDVITGSISPGGKDVDTDSYPGIVMNDGDNSIIVWSQYDDDDNYQIFTSECR